jgi:hypothetical protein
LFLMRHEQGRKLEGKHAPTYALSPVARSLFSCRERML